MNFIEELQWRGMLHQATPEVEAHLNSGKRIGYIGFDPTAPSLTIGNFVQIMILKFFQLSGHQPIVLMGGATGRIGDPSGKDKERDLKSFEELDANLARQMEQFKKFLDFDSADNKALVKNNYDFYASMNVLEFLRDIGKNITVNYMQSKDSVKTRLSGDGEGMSFTEFSYQVLQGYDFVHLYNNVGCTIQMGGSDQWGNITSGTHLIGKMLEDAKAYAVTTPLLTKADGSKFGKSEEGNIWLDPDMTSPYKFYQFWINSNDADIPKFIRYFSLKSREEIEAMEKEMEGNPQALKRALADELTARVHSPEELETVKAVTELLFGKNASKESLLSLPEKALETIGGEIPKFQVAKSDFENGTDITTLLTELTSMLPSKSEARRAIQGNAVSVNKEKVNQLDEAITAANLLHGRFIMVENGKKNKFLIEAV
ncbi:MAG: tyrosine--tRNA ligase [Saprospiraceae bacterium]|nr:tyrosine--tRNA ligase [Saprospiraceae bacterium]